jgi:hypothetical protein
VTHHVVACQLAEVDVIDVGQDLPDQAQPRHGAVRQVHLGDVAGDHYLRAEAEPGQEHLHLLRRGVLRFVQDDERVVQRPTAHVRQRRDLDGAGGHQPRDRVRVDHVVQRVVERAQVRVDLLVQRAGQEAEALAGLDRGPGEDDPVDLLRLQRLHGLGHGQVGLAGTGGADAEDDGVLVDRVHVTLLVERLGPNGAAAVGQDVERQHVGGPLVGGRAQDGDGPLHRLLGQRRAGAQHQQHLVEEPPRQADLVDRTRRGDLVAAHVDVHAGEALLDDPQQAVAGAEQPDHRVLGGDGDPDGLGPLLLGVGARRRAIARSLVSGTVTRLGRGLPGHGRSTVAGGHGLAGRPGHACSLCGRRRAHRAATRPGRSSYD